MLKKGSGFGRPVRGSLAVRARSPGAVECWYAGGGDSGGTWWRYFKSSGCHRRQFGQLLLLQNPE